MTEKKESEPLFAWFTRWKRRKHGETLLVTLAEVKQLKDLINKQPCTACGQNGLKLEDFVRGPKGWDATVTCDNCNFNGVINSTGFNFTRINRES
jgi:hypothetical protein